MKVSICWIWLLYWGWFSVAWADLIPDAPTIDANAYILKDFYSGAVLMEKNADEPVEPASLTKLMTAYLIFERLENNQLVMNEKVRVSEKAWKMHGSRMYLEVDSVVTIEELLKGMIIQSGNDASLALAEHVAGSEENFVRLMNEKAQSLGLTRTHYTNSTGLSEENHYSTARDLVRMASYIIRDYPEFYRWYSVKEYTYNNITQNNRNLLLWRDESVDGMKTGYTDNAKYCLIASAKRGNMRLISVVLGAKNKKARATESQKMLDYGFRFYETYHLYNANQALNTERVWKGNTNEIQLGLTKPLYITIPKGQYPNLQATLHVNKQIQAPIAKGEVLGSLRITLGKYLVTERALIALYAVESGNIFRQFLDHILLQFQ